jgi:predicted nucleic acid-binding protein
MIVVSDTSPLHYLILIGAEGVLPELFGRVIAPTAVIDEMVHPHAPQTVRDWASDTPEWLEILDPESSVTSVRLGPGESAAIAIATELQADAVL